ncbi:MAG: type II toxin-antitoxin system PemK/MazF family toxin [Candidatus Bipolaricaulia bacterium]
MNLTSPRRGEVWLVRIPGEQKQRPCVILSAKCDQVTTIDKKHLGQAPLGQLSSTKLAEIEHAVRQALRL